MTGLLAAIPPLASAAFLPFWSMRSDRSKERYWHSIGPMAVAGLGWFMAAELPAPAWRLLGLTIAGVFSIAVWSPFFTMPSAVLPRRAHAVGIAFLNTIGMCGAALTPLAMGRLKDYTGGFAAPMLFVGATLIFGALLMLLAPRTLLNGSGAAPKIDVGSPAVTRI
jgi:ACS family 4-hydroxyphenylacetate permease-like MFS transporter